MIVRQDQEQNFPLSSNKLALDIQIKNKSKLKRFKNVAIIFTFIFLLMIIFYLSRQIYILRNKDCNQNKTSIQNNTSFQSNKSIIKVLPKEVSPQQPQNFTKSQITRIENKEISKKNTIQQQWLQSFHKYNPKSLIDHFKVNKKGQNAAKVIYSPKKILEREQFNNKRNKRISRLNNNFVKLAKYNLVTDIRQLSIQQKIESEEYMRLEKKFNLSKYSSELPICILSTGYNNNEKFRIQYNLNSVFTQNYTNYLMVIVNDASTDGSGDVFTKYLEFYDIPKDRYQYVLNEKRKVSAENIYTNAIKFCKDDSILAILDADDQLLGKNVFKVLNAVYQKTNSGVVYSNFFMFEKDQGKIGYSRSYKQEDIKGNLYRKAGSKASHLRTYRTELLKKMDVSYLKLNNQKFVYVAADMALTMTLMQMSCGRVHFIQGEIQVLYHMTGKNIYTKLSSSTQQAKEVNKIVRAKTPATCDKQFQKKMEMLENI